MPTPNGIIYGRDLPDFRTFLRNPVTSPLTITGTAPELRFDDTTGGDDNYRITVDADQFRIANDDGNGTQFVLEDEAGEDYLFLVDNDNLIIRNTTGPVDFLTLTGGATDTITLQRDTKVTGILTIESTIPLLIFSDTNSDDYNVTVDGGTMEILNAAGNATIVQLTDNGGGEDFSLKADNNIFTITAVSAAKTWEFKNSGFLRHHTRCTHLDTSSTGNVGTGLDTLRSISIVAATLDNDNDYLEIEFGGFFATNDDDKRLFCSFGGSTIFDTTLADFDGGAWYVKLLIVRTSSTTCRVIGQAVEQFLNNLGGTAGGNGAIGGVNVVSLSVSNLDSNSNTLLLQGESATATNDNVVCNASKVEVNQLT